MHRKYNIIRREPSVSKSEKKSALDRDRTRVLLHHILLPYPLRHEDEMKILMKKRNFVKVEMEGLLGVKVPCLMPIRVKEFFFSTSSVKQ